MKTCAGVAGAIVGLAVVALFALYLVPRLKAGSKPVSPAAAIAPAIGTGFGDTPGRIDVPTTDEDRARQELTQKRLPFFHLIYEKFGDQVEHASVLHDTHTLDLVVKTDDQAAIQSLVQKAVAPTGRNYGFTSVRFYVNNPLGSVEPYRVVAESSWDGSSRWNTFLK